MEGLLLPRPQRLSRIASVSIQGRVHFVEPFTVKWLHIRQLFSTTQAKIVFVCFRDGSHHRDARHSRHRED